MVTVLSFLPEFNRREPEPETTPERWPRDVAGCGRPLAGSVLTCQTELLRSLETSLLEYGHIRQRTALFTHPRVYLAFDRTSREVGVALILRRSDNTPFEAYLPAKLVPMQYSRRVGVGVNVRGLTRFVVAVERHITVDARKILYQHDARRRPRRTIDRGQCHGIRVSLHRLSNGIVEPGSD